jgi:hypothetical protein
VRLEEAVVVGERDEVKPVAAALALVREHLIHPCEVLDRVLERFDPLLPVALRKVAARALVVLE